MHASLKNRVDIRILITEKLSPWLLSVKGKLKRSVKAHIEAGEDGMHKIEFGKPTVAWKVNHVVNIKIMKFTSFRLHAA